MMCKYCEKENTKRIKGKFGSIVLKKNINGKLCIQTYNDELIIYYPKYCPECGRKLQTKKQLLEKMQEERKDE